MFRTGINAVFLVILITQWRIRHTGLPRVFDYNLYRRTQAY